ncbi:MAG: NYN domain-containing protein [Desulfobacterales bacterium]|jgi:predicted RNA-binding protein with PIN domain
MPIHIIIDGYNLIRQSPELSNLERTDFQQGRVALIERLAAYKKIKPHKITVVFDGSKGSSFSGTPDFFKGIEIRFSRANESADTVIKKMARQQRQKALVVSSDREIITAAESWGAASISSPNFEKKLVNAEYLKSKGPNQHEADDRRSWKGSTQKKGPRRRLSKRMRRNKLKIKKL